MSVTLVFANKPELGGRRRLRIAEDEVAFTRSVRLNRKNQPISSYRIGERSVTATEMRRTLAEAGLHGDGYNIVLQGDVTNLATMTDWKRRGVLEEVAGVTAYDSEIRSANNQRKVVENDIETIELFESDQKARLKKLEKEREQALKYRDLKEQLDQARIILAQAKYRNRVDEIRMLNEDHEKYQEKATRFVKVSEVTNLVFYNLKKNWSTFLVNSKIWRLENPKRLWMRFDPWKLRSKLAETELVTKTEPLKMRSRKSNFSNPT